MAKCKKVVYIWNRYFTVQWNVVIKTMKKFLSIIDTKNLFKFFRSLTCNKRNCRILFKNYFIADRKICIKISSPEMQRWDGLLGMVLTVMTLTAQSNPMFILIFIIKCVREMKLTWNLCFEMTKRLSRPAKWRDGCSIAHLSFIVGSFEIYEKRNFFFRLSQFLRYLISTPVKFMTENSVYSLIARMNLRNFNNFFKNESSEFLWFWPDQQYICLLLASVSLTHQSNSSHSIAFQVKLSQRIVFRATFPIVHFTCHKIRRNFSCLLFLYDVRKFSYRDFVTSKK